MRRNLRIAAGLAAVVTAAGLGQTADPTPGLKDAPTKDGFPNFRVHQIASDLTIGYAVVTADIDGDKKSDIVVVDKHRVVWYQNPTWQARTILQGQTKPDNVCITPIDITGDGLPELVLGAAWKPFDTATPGTLQWLKRGATLDSEWSLHPIPCDEPTVHRIRTADIDGDGKPEVVHVPLIGRDATAKANWMNGRPVRVIAYRIPQEPEKPENWKPTVLANTLHVMHNFHPTTRDLPGQTSIITASYEGVHRIVPVAGVWTSIKLGEGNQANPTSNRGASEVKMGHLAAGRKVIATIEPWHGNQVVAYTPPAKEGAGPLWARHVVDEQLRWGHAVSFADLDADGVDELVIGVRDDPNLKAGDKHTQRRGVRLYRSTDGIGAAWDRHIIEDGGVAVEDLTVADLNADGRPDIVAVGRATGNCRIYWNQGK